MDLIHPHSKRDVVDALRAASAAETRVLIVGGRRHIDKGNPSQVDAELWTTVLDDRIAYDPAEMLCVVEAGMRIHDLTAMLAEGGQEWPVDAPGDATVGGVIASGAATIRQLRVGAMRDTIVEMEVVTGDGRLIKSGARTVKNVTGYDVHRLLTGSLGTLGVIVQVALKVRPLPKATRTLVSDEGGLELGHRVLDAVPLPAAVLAEPERGRRRSRSRPRQRDRWSRSTRPTLRSLTPASRRRRSSPRPPSRRPVLRPCSRGPIATARAWVSASLGSRSKTKTRSRRSVRAGPSSAGSHR